MGELAFGKTFSLLKDPETTSHTDSNDAPTLISHGMSMLRFFTPVPWVGHLCFTFAPYLPIITQKWNRALKWAVKICDERLDRDSNHGNHDDAFSRFIFTASKDNDRRSFDRLALYGDAFAIIVAGSHSTAATITMLCFELARHPEVQHQARTEVLAAHYGQENNSNSNAPTQERYPFLDACITETLRLYPVVPTGGIRQTVAKGISVGGSWIPPDTVIVVPRWTLGRRTSPNLLQLINFYLLVECAFDMPNEFIPERWTTKTHMVKDARAFNGFGIGQHVCPGKQLGLAEVRLVVAMLLTNFRFSHDPREVNRNKTVDGIQDSFTLMPGEFNLVFNSMRKPELT